MERLIKYHPVYRLCLLALTIFCLASCSSSDPAGQRTLANYQLANKKQVRVVYANSKAQTGHSILVELISNEQVDSVLYRFDDYKFLQFAHLQPDSAIIVAIRRDTTAINLDTYIINIPH